MRLSQAIQGAVLFCLRVFCQIVFCEEFPKRRTEIVGHCAIRQAEDGQVAVAIEQFAERKALDGVGAFE